MQENGNYMDSFGKFLHKMLILLRFQTFVNLQIQVAATLQQTQQRY